MNLPDDVQEQIEAVLKRLADRYDYEVEVFGGEAAKRAMGRRDAINDVWQALGLPVREEEAE